MDDMLSVSGHVKGIPVEASILAVCLPILSWVWRPNPPLPECGIHHGSEEEVPQDTLLANARALLSAQATTRVYRPSPRTSVRLAIFALPAIKVMLT
jgi:hypothetical protein